MKLTKLFAPAILLVLAAGAANPAPRDIYPDPSQAGPDLAAALRTAAQSHKRILLDFGGNWCGDCIVLDMYMHNPQNRAILEANFVLVHINVGYADKNLDIARKYEVPLDKGVPALAVGPQSSATELAPISSRRQTRATPPTTASPLVRPVRQLNHARTAFPPAAVPQLLPGHAKPAPVPMPARTESTSASLTSMRHPAPNTPLR